MISFNKITKTFGGRAVLRHVDLSIQPGQFAVIRGASGAGKSTIIHLLIASETPDHGVVKVDDMVVSEMDSDTKQLYRRKIGVVFQEYQLLSKKTVFENVAFAMEVCNETDEEIKQRVPEVLKKVGLDKFKTKFPHQLSGGERQRLAIARALVHQPRLILADEPTGNLDQENAKGIIDLLKQLNKEGATVILTTHNPQVQAWAGGRDLVIENGKIIG